jgi:hypothetical protein
MPSKDKGKAKATEKEDVGGEMVVDDESTTVQVRNEYVSTWEGTSKERDRMRRLWVRAREEATRGKGSTPG